LGNECSTYGCGEVYTGFWWENLRNRDDLEDPDIDRRIILIWISSKWDMSELTG